MPKERDILKIIWTTFVNSLRPKRTNGNLMGKDRFGNQYFEIPADPSAGKRKPQRWFFPGHKENLDKFDREMPAEWEAWLRGRRDIPPTEREELKNYAIAQLKKQNAAELEAQQRQSRATQEALNPPPPEVEKAQEFPVYSEYEIRPGVPRGEDKDKDNK